jgi:probable HAF family extracellular repeat protein
MLRSRVSAAVVLVCLVIAGASRVTRTQSAVQYGLDDLGTLGEVASYADDIDWRGRVVGVTTGTRERAFLYDGEKSVHLDTIGGTLGGARSFAIGIGPTGQITGWSNPVGSTTSRAYVYDGFSTRAIGTLGGSHSIGQDINSFGSVVGSSSLPNGDEHAFIFDGATMRDLGTFGGRYSYAYALNDDGWVTGSAFTPNFTAQRAFLYNGGTLRDLGTLGGTNSIGRDINNSGWVVGGANAASGAWRAFVHDGTSMRSLGTLGGASSEAFGVNDAGDIVGEATLPSGETHAFISAGGQMLDLNSMIDSASGWVLTAARAINDAGQVAGFGTVGGQTRAFRLTPVQDLVIYPFGVKTLQDSNRPNPVEVGRPVTFVMSVAGNGVSRPAARQTVTVTDIISGPVEVTSAGVVDGPACAVAGQTVTCSLTEIGFDEREVQIAVRPTAPGAFTHTARVSGQTPELDAANNEITEENTAVSLAGLTLTPSTIPGGKLSTVRVNLTGPAPASGAIVKLASSNPAIAPVPSSIEVLGAGITRALNIIPKVVAVPTPVVISATYGAQTRNVTLTVIPPVLGTLYLTPTTIIGGCGTSAGKVVLTGAAPAMGAVVTLSNSNTAASLPASVVVPPGGTSKSFTVTTQLLTALRYGTVTAQYGSVSKTLKLTVRPIGVRSLTLTPNPVVGGNGVRGTVILECGAAPGSALVTFSSSNTAIAAPTASTITIPAGSTTGSFSVRTTHSPVAAAATIYATVHQARKGAILSVNP